MSSLERVLKTLRFEEPDRVPFFEQGVASNVASEVLGREALTGGGAFRRLGVEAAIAGSDACAEYQERYFADWCALLETLEFDVATLPWAGGGIPSAKLDENTYLYGNRDGAYAVLRFDPVSDTMHTVDSSLRGAGGLREVEMEIRAMAEGHADRPSLCPSGLGCFRVSSSATGDSGPSAPGHA